MIRPAFFLSLLFAIHARGEITITTKQGQNAQCEVLGVSGTVVTISRNNQKSTLRLNQLADSSAAEVLAFAKEKGLYNPFPPLKITPSVATKRSQDERVSYKKIMTIKPQIVFAGASALEPIPAGQATMMIIAMDTRAKYVGKIDKHVVHASETKEIPAAVDGKPRIIEFDPSLTSFDSYRDTSNVGGFVYKHYVFALRDPESGKIVDFQTNHAQLQAFAQKNPEKREELLKLAKGAQFPVEFR